MFFMEKKLSTLFNLGAALAASFLFVACLDIPDKPEIDTKIMGVSVYIKQGKNIDSTLLKINSRDSSTLIAAVYPTHYKNEVQYYWYSDEDLLDSGKSYGISTSFTMSGNIGESFIPNKLVVKDKNDNFIEEEFRIILNAPPVLSQKTIPASGDTIYGNEFSPVTFSWECSEFDLGQQLEYTITIDDTDYAAGSFTQIRQSGFREGMHQYRITVSDPYGDKDSTELITFYMKEAKDE